ncbi:amino acid-binding protein, partial [Micromonospora fiedleri]|nr:amino acid-binding protein [Micromonospora fiedleri]
GVRGSGGGWRVGELPWGGPGAGRVERLVAGLGASPGGRVGGVWRAFGAPTTTGQDAELLAQVAANPTDGLATLVDAVPGLLAADWAVAAVVPVDCASRTGGGGATVAHASRRPPDPPRLPEVAPLPARYMTVRRAGYVSVAAFGPA